MLLIAFCLGALVAFVTQPITYTSTLILFEVGECIGTYFVQQAVLKVYRDYKDNSVEAIFEYYLFKPHFLRLFFRLAGFFSALILALIAMYSRRAILNEFAWFTVVTTFVVSETIIWYWRRQRDANLPTQDGVPVTSVNAQSEDG